LGLRPLLFLWHYWLLLSGCPAAALPGSRYHELNPAERNHKARLTAAKS
jgi:hypothetical protein